MIRRRAVAHTAAAMSLLLALLGACSNETAQKKNEAPPVPVNAAPAVTQDMPVVLRVVGRAEAYESVAIKSRVDGQVQQVLFNEGQHVQQGDILLRLDPADFTARLQQAQAATARDEALLGKMRADTARYVALRQRNFVSEEKVNDVRTNEATALANVAASKAAVEVARLQLSYVTVRAPFTGVVGARLVFPGTAVKANDVTLAVVNRVQPLLVSFAIPEKHLPQLRSARAKGKVKVDINETGNTAQHYAGQVRFVDNAVDTTTGTIQLKAELPNADEKLTPGQFLDVALVLDTLKNSVTVPNSAIQQGADGPYLYALKADNTVEQRRVEALASENGFTAVRGPLQAGETVITDGHLRLVPGTKVEVRENGIGKDQADGEPKVTAGKRTQS